MWVLQLSLPTILWGFYRWGTWSSVGLSNLPKIWKARKKWNWDLKWNMPPEPMLYSEYTFISIWWLRTLSHLWTTILKQEIVLCTLVAGAIAAGAGGWEARPRPVALRFQCVRFLWETCDSSDSQIPLVRICLWSTLGDSDTDGMRSTLWWTSPQMNFPCECLCSSSFPPFFLSSLFLLCLFLLHFLSFSYPLVFSFLLLLSSLPFSLSPSFFFFFSGFCWLGSDDLMRLYISTIPGLSNKTVHSLQAGIGDFVSLSLTLT